MSRCSGGFVASFLALLCLSCWRSPDMMLSVECVEVRPSTTELSIDEFDSNNNLGSILHDQVRRLHLSYEVRGSGTGAVFMVARGGTPAHVLLLVSEPVQKSADLPVPREGGDVIYLLTGGEWKPYPTAVANPSRHLLRVRPDASQGGAFTIDCGMGSLMRFRPSYDSFKVH